MDENKNKKIIAAAAVIFCLMIVVVFVYFLFFAGKKMQAQQVAPTTTATAATATPTAPKVEAPKKQEPEFIEKIENYDTGELKAKYYIYREKPEIKHKEYKEFYKSGKINIECVYKDNVIDSPYIYWYENGTKALEGNVRNGRKEGAFTENHPDGKKKFTYSYKDGKLDGQWIEYFDDDKSTVMTEKNYAAGELTGNYKYCSTDGKIKISKNYGGTPPETVPATVPDKPATPAPAPPTVPEKPVPPTGKPTKPTGPPFGPPPGFPTPPGFPPKPGVPPIKAPAK